MSVFVTKESTPLFPKEQTASAAMLLLFWPKQKGINISEQKSIILLKCYTGGGGKFFDNVFVSKLPAFPLS